MTWTICCYGSEGPFPWQSSFPQTCSENFPVTLGKYGLKSAEICILKVNAAFRTITVICPWNIIDLFDHYTFPHIFRSQVGRGWEEAVPTPPLWQRPWLFLQRDYVI